jgi:transposase
MPMAQLIITAVTVEGRSKSEVARGYGVSRFWVQQLIKRFDAEGVAAFQPRSRRPHSSPHAVDADTEEMILRLRKELSKQGLDAGSETIAAHLARRAPADGGRPAIPAVSTIWRILSRRGFVRPQPQKRPRSSWRTFCAEQPNERWQTDITHWQLADGTEVSILNILDDHSRLCLGSHARRHTTGPDVVASFRKAFAQWGIPAGVLSDIQAWWCLEGPWIVRPAV